MKNPFLFGLIAILLLGGTITPAALSQSSPSSSFVVINEVEINPLNGAEFVELYNPTSQPVDISGWSLTPSLTWKTYEIVANTIIEPQSFAAFTYSSSWFKDFGDTISLTNSSGELIDQTPLLADQNNDADTWQRNTDGLDTNSISDWKLKTMTPKSSNGIIIETQETFYSFTAQTEKTEYTFGETLMIHGSTTESLFKDAHESIPEFINIEIQGPNYHDTFTVFPDRDLNFSITLDIKEVVGFNTGNYNVDISYGDNSVKTEFLVTDELADSSVETESQTLEILTDKTSYMTGETIIVFGKTNSSIEYAGMDYAIIDPNGKQISSGTIFPNTEFSTVHKSGGGEIYPFSTQLLMHGVNPVYGTYVILGTFKAQDPLYRSAGVELSARATFELVEDVKDDKIFSLSTDKELYSVNDTIVVTGRSNQIWTENIALEVQQTGVLTRAADAHKDQYIRPDPFTLKKSVDLNADGTFEFKFNLIESFDSEEDLSRYFGDYRVTVSEYFGNEYVNFKVVANPESFVDIRTPLGLQMDKSEYILGTAINVSGKVMDYDQSTRFDNFNNFIKFTIADSNGKTMMSEDRRTTSIQYESHSPNSPLTFTAIPDAIGNFQISAILNPIQFDIGEYTINAIHPISKTTESIGFKIITAQSELLPTTETQEPLVFEICSSVRHDISEIIKDLKQIGKGEIPPSMDSVNCDGTKDFVTGEKLVIRGNVALKDSRSLDQSSVKTSGQTQSGSSYTTNFAQAQLNYIELSIPYPQTLLISTSYQTSDETGEYHGGGGSGTQCTSGGSGTKWSTNPTTGAQYSSTVTSTCQQSFDTGVDRDDAPSERHTGYDGEVILRQVTKNLTDMKVKAYPDAEGNFYAVFDLRAGIFVDGIYKLKSSYYGYKYDQSFSVTDNSLKGGLAPDLILAVDKKEYVAGETVSVFGKIENIFYYDSVSLKIETPDVSKINCLVGQQCGFGNYAKKVRVSEGTDGALFFMNYKLPSDPPIGKYTVIADTHFGQMKHSFFVINESDVIESVSSPSSDSSSKPLKIIEKFNRISDNKIPIILDEKSTEDSTLVPRVIQGSLFTSARGEESTVNLRITATNGQCVIGPDSNCLVSESTRKPGEIYSLVSIDDTNYNIRYSGNDVRLEKFSIIPADSNSKIDIDSWNVEIIKDEQPTRFYYKVSYVTLE